MVARVHIDDIYTYMYLYIIYIIIYIYTVINYIIYTDIRYIDHPISSTLNSPIVWFQKGGFSPALLNQQTTDLSGLEVTLQ